LEKGKQPRNILKQYPEKVATEIRVANNRLR
jgi:hypothetical protein